MSRLLIDAKQRKRLVDLKEIRAYKDLFWTLAYRDFRVRYAQTYLGFLWALLQPLAMLVIVIFVFNKVAKIDIENVPYPVYALAGMMPWTYFAFTMNQSGSSIINAAEMVKKIYFPRLVIPLSKAVVGFIDFLAVFAILVGFMIYYQYLPPSQIIYLPIFLLLTALSAVGIGIFVSALTIRYRDFQHIVPFAVQIGFYATPIAYPSSIVPEQYQLLFHLNPMAGVVEGFRWCLVGGPAPHKFAYISFTLVIILFIWSLFYFRKTERIMADIV